MSPSLQANRRLLCAVINGPFLLAPPRVLPVRSRCLTTSIPRRNDGLAGRTVSSGPPAETSVRGGGDRDNSSTTWRKDRAKSTARLNTEEQHTPPAGRSHGARRDVGGVDGPGPARTSTPPGATDGSASQTQRPKRLDPNAPPARQIKERDENKGVRSGQRDATARKPRWSERDTKASPSKRPKPWERKPDPEEEPSEPKELPNWAIQKNALARKFADSGGWNPKKKLSPDAIIGIKQLHAKDPVLYSTPVLADQFKVSPEAIRRILRSKWMDTAGEEKMQERRARWAKRHDAIWDQQVQLGLRPPRRKERRVRDASEGADEVQESLWREEVLQGARQA